MDMYAWFPGSFRCKFERYKELKVLEITWMAQRKMHYNKRKQALKLRSEETHWLEVKLEKELAMEIKMEYPVRQKAKPGHARRMCQEREAYLCGSLGAVA